LEDRPAKIKAAILPYDQHDVEAALKRLAEQGFIERYSFEDGGKRYIQITNFRKHQCPNTKEPQSAIPPLCRNNTGAKQDTVPAPCRDGSGTPRLGKGKEGKGESEYLKPLAPKPPLPITRTNSSEKANTGKPIRPNGAENSPDQHEKAAHPEKPNSPNGNGRPARAGPMPGEERGKYDGIAENI